MRPVMWLLAEVVRLLVRFAVTACLLVLGCSVRLLYWSVRTYGWGPVAGFLAALCLSLWLHISLGRLALTGASVAALTATTLVVWAGLWAGASWAVRRGRRWLAPAPLVAPSPSPSGIVPGVVPAEARAFVPSLPAARSQAPVFSPSADPPKGGDLWARIVSVPTLQQAWRRVLARGGGPGPDGVTVEAFAAEADQHLQALAKTLAGWHYHPAAPRRIAIPKPTGGTRVLAVLCVRDRIVQQAIHSVLAPLWDGRLAPCSYAYRSGRSPVQAVAAVERALEAGRIWVVDGDIEAFFDSVPHAPLFTLLGDWLPDEALRELVRRCVASTSGADGRGLAQGAPLSPLLANVYLHRFDQALLDAGHALVRYADDFVILCATRLQAEVALQMADRLLRGLGLGLNRAKSRVMHRDEGFTFLGYAFSRDGKRPSDGAIASLRDRLAAASGGEARQIAAGWEGYFGQGAAALASTTSVTPVPMAEPPGVLEDAPWWMAEDNPTPEATEIAGRIPHGASWSTGAVGAMAGEGKPEAAAPPSQSREPSGGPPSPRTLEPPNPSAPLSLYLERFWGRRDVFARYWRRDGRNGYLPARRPVTGADLRCHLAGKCALGTYLLHPDGTTRAVVFDVDGPDPGEAGRAAAFRVAHDLARAFVRERIGVFWVDSGGKGYHLWLCFSAPVAARPVRQWASCWLERLRPLPDGVGVEVFPKQDSLPPSGLGALIRLPLGRHPETGRPSVLLSPEGKPIGDPWAALTSTPQNDPGAVLNADGMPLHGYSWPEPPTAIAPVVRGCALVWALVRKAAETRYLRHAERLALLYAVGSLGEAGRAYLHQVIGLCSNYDPRITERWAQRLEAGHRPIRCATLKEWLRDHVPGVACPCIPQAANPSPIHLLRASARGGRRPAGQTPEGSQAAWEDVAQEMFGEALPARAPAAGDGVE